MLAVLAGLLSPVPQVVRVACASVLIVALAVLDLVAPRLPLPQRSTLIPQHVFSRGLARGLLRFGVEYGTGVRTLIPGAAPYLCAVYLVLTNQPWWLTLAAGAVFGFSRSLAILQFVLLGRDGWAQFLTGHSRILERMGSVLAAVLLLTAVLAT
ncbi:hypothetical protein [Ornithinimicrobium sp.]|uniref:hypothetical protein n=1 Tax=Ornithinimicrobium sp. TaxID=1977084 RepID=UPI003D9B9196